METGTSGPFVAAALVCERLLKEVDNVSSYIRVIDRFIFPEHPMRARFTVVLVLKSGSLKGQYPVALSLLTPDGQSREMISAPVDFDGGELGIEIVTNAEMQFEIDGLHWFDVTVDGRVITRIPLQIVLSEATSLGSESASG